MTSRRVTNAPTTNLAAIDATLAALTALGRLEAVDAALVQLARSLAAAVDADPANASLAREYRATEAALRATGGANDDRLAQALAALSSPVGHAKKG